MSLLVVKVPDVGEGVAEVEIVSWAVAIGQTVTRNEVLAEVMTDKANVEIPSPVNGVIAALNGEIGATMAVGSPLIELTVDDANSAGSTEPARAAAGVTDAPSGSGAGAAAGVTDAPSGSGAAGVSTGVTDAPSGSGAAGVSTGVTEAPSGSGAAGVSTGVTDAPSGSVAEAGDVAAGAATVGASARPSGPPRAEGDKPRATPAVRHRAREAGVDLRRVAGTGPAGRITHDDLDHYLRNGSDRVNGGDAAASAPGARSANLAVDEQPIVGIRRKIAEHMVASTSTIPHITYVEEVDVTHVEELRAMLNDQRAEARPRLTLLPFLIRALVKVLPEFPSMNAHVDDDRGVLTSYGGVHVGIATQTPNGLVVPVIRHAEALSIWEIADALNNRAEAARTGRASPADLRGSTITITSLGPLGGLVTTPVINKPEVAIVGVNKISTRPVWADSAFVPRKMMNLSSSFDHRVIDGWDAASFVQGLRRSLEQPAMLFIDEP